MITREAPGQLEPLV